MKIKIIGFLFITLLPFQQIFAELLKLEHPCFGLNKEGDLKEIKSKSSSCAIDDRSSDVIKGTYNNSSKVPYAALTLPQPNPKKEIKTYVFLDLSKGDEIKENLKSSLIEVKEENKKLRVISQTSCISKKYLLSHSLFCITLNKPICDSIKDPKNISCLQIKENDPEKIVESRILCALSAAYGKTADDNGGDKKYSERSFMANNRTTHTFNTNHILDSYRAKGLNFLGSQASSGTSYLRLGLDFLRRTDSPHAEKKVQFDEILSRCSHYFSEELFTPVLNSKDKDFNAQQK